MNATPGPWIADQLTNAELRGDFLAVLSANDRSKVIAITGRTIGGELQDEASANTATIASLPELMDALIQIQCTCDQELGEWNGVQPPYIPSYMMPLYEIQKIVSQAFEKISAEAE